MRFPRLPVLGILLPVLGACTGVPEDGLELHSATAEAFSATLTLDGEVIAIESSVGEAAAATDGTDADIGIVERVRTTTAIGAGGAIYARLVTAVEGGERRGSFGGHDFGGAADDEATDWAQVLAGRAGTVALAIETFAADAEGGDAAVDALADLRAVGGTLRQLAGEGDLQSISTSSCDYDHPGGPGVAGSAVDGRNRMYTVLDAGCGASSCQIGVYGLLAKWDSKRCSRKYFAKVYNDADVLLASAGTRADQSGYLLLQASWHGTRKTSTTTCFYIRTGDAVLGLSSRLSVCRYMSPNEDPHAYNYRVF